MRGPKHAVAMVTQPRVLCYKLLAKVGRSGIYLKVVQEGEVGAGDAIELMSQTVMRSR